MKIDKETAAILHQSEELRLMVKSEGWQIAKRRLVELTASLGSVDTLDTDKKTPTAIVNELRSNNRARKILLSWLAEIEGAVEHGQFIKEMLAKQREDAITDYFDQ